MRWSWLAKCENVLYKSLSTSAASTTQVLTRRMFNCNISKNNYMSTISVALKQNTSSISRRPASLSRSHVRSRHVTPRKRTQGSRGGSCVPVHPTPTKTWISSTTQWTRAPVSIGRSTFSFIVGPVSRSKVCHKLRTFVIFMWFFYSVKFCGPVTTCARSVDSWGDDRGSLKRRTTSRRPTCRRTSLDARFLIKDFFSWLLTEWETGAPVTEWQNRMTSEIGICMMDITLDGWLIVRNT